MNTCQIHQPSQTASRLHGFDAVRVVGMLLVVLLHAAAPYLKHPMPGLLWPTREPPNHLAIDGLFWWIEGFIMTLFFALSGYFACQLYQRRGLAGFLWQRGGKLLIPLVLATFVILPLTAYVWVLGWVIEGQVAAVKLRSFKFTDDVAADFFGFAHLWYLQYLSIYCLAMGGLLAIGNWWKKNSRSATQSASLGQSLAIPIVGFACCAFLLAVDPAIIIGFQQSIPPVTTRLAYFGIVFGVGVWLYNRKNGVAELQKPGWPALIGSMVVFGCTLPIILAHLGHGVSIPWSIAMAVGGNTFAWLSTIAIVGLFTRYASQRNAIVNYLAAASFWTYLAHMPIVGAVHIALAQAALGVELKLAISFVFAVGLSLASYEVLVRRLRVAAWFVGEVFSQRPKRMTDSPQRISSKFDQHVIREAA